MQIFSVLIVIYALFCTKIEFKTPSTCDDPDFAKSANYGV